MSRILNWCEVNAVWVDDEYVVPIALLSPLDQFGKPTGKPPFKAGIDTLVIQ